MPRKLSKTITPAVQRLRTRGLTVAQWAEAQDFNVRAVRAVISGHNKGLYGQAFRIARALEAESVQDDAP